MYKIVILSVFVSFIACNQKNAQTEENLSKEKDRLSILIEKMYYKDIHSRDALYDTLIFSKEIVALNSKCDSVTKADIERIAKSNYPTDKPVLREGSRVSSLYEGVTNFTINDIKTINDKKVVSVTLSNKHYPTLKPWKERIVFIEQNSLKVDNIYFNEEILNSTKPNLKKSLMNFIKQVDEWSDQIK